jgi:ADP-L-glycero-D-manno-heptose 6-epimerase
MVFQFRNQIRDTGVAKLFGAAGGYGDGEQRRDFVYVEDLIDINLFFWQRDPVQTVVNAGSGTARTWKDVASAVIAAMGTGRIEFIPFPSALLDKYQFYTQSDVTRLRSLGFTKQMTQVEEGIQDYFTKERESQQLFSRKQ